jgi:CRISPR system Cascade subunit CasA
MNPSFDLLKQRWIPCRTLDRQPINLGIQEALLRSHELLEVRDPSPLTTAALLRLLVAVLHAAHGRPWTNGRRADLWELGQWNAGLIECYLDQWRERFDLFDRRYPFYQDGSFELPQPVTIARLAPELTSGNNATLFDHTVDASPPAVDPPACARWVVTYQAFTLGGGQGATSARYGKHPNLRHAPAALGALALLRGRNLFQTLLLNMVPYTDREPFLSKDDDCALWQRTEFPEPRESSQPGYLAYLTWPIRCLRLRPEATEGGWVVRYADVAQGPYFPSGPRDPFFAMRVSAANEPVPLRLSAERALWRDSSALFRFSDSRNPGRGAGEIAIVPRPRVLQEAADLEDKVDQIPLSCLVVGLDFDQAKVNLWRAEELPVPHELLTDRDRVELLCDAVHDANEIGGALRGALRFLACVIMKPDEPMKADKSSAEELERGWGAEAGYWPALEEPFRRLLRRLSERPEGRYDAFLEWRRTAIAAANDAFGLAERQAGGSARVLRARVEAWRRFVRRTWEWQALLRRAEQPEEITKDAEL